MIFNKAAVKLNKELIDRLHRRLIMAESDIIKLNKCIVKTNERMTRVEKKTLPKMKKKPSAKKEI